MVYGNENPQENPQEKPQNAKSSSHALNMILHRNYDVTNSCAKSYSKLVLRVYASDDVTITQELMTSPILVPKLYSRPE